VRLQSRKAQKVGDSDEARRYALPRKNTVIMYTLKQRCVIPQSSAMAGYASKLPIISPENEDTPNAPRTHRRSGIVFARQLKNAE